MGWIGRAWRGEERLWKVFWVYGLLLGIVLAIVTSIIKSVVPFGIVIYVAVKIVFTIWIWVALWRSAFNAEWTVWGYVVRILIIISLLLIALMVAGIFVGGAMVGQDMIKAAQCRQELKAYVAQGGKDVEAFKKECVARHQQKDEEPADTTSGGPSIMGGIKAGWDCGEQGAQYEKNGGTDRKGFEQKCIEQRVRQMTGQAPPAPPTPAADVPPGQDAYKQQCEQTMTETAQKAGVDPQGYIAQNQAYLQQCMKYYADQDAANKKP